VNGGPHSRKGVTDIQSFSFGPSIREVNEVGNHINGSATSRTLKRPHSRQGRIPKSAPTHQNNRSQSRGQSQERPCPPKMHYSERTDRGRSRNSKVRTTFD
jgi:hypothetical protein